MALGMSIREAILCVVLAVVGAIAFRQAQLRDQRRLAELVRRGRALSHEVRALRQRRRDLRREADALCHDRYYVERVARAELHWQPEAGRGLDSPLPRLAPPAASPSALVQGLPSLAPSFPLPAVLEPPKPPTGQQCLAWLGYDTVEHFQRKMMTKRPSGTLDDATVARARQLVAMMQQLGFESVKAFQRRHGLTPDGILGRKTERRARRLLQRQHPGQASNFLADNGGPRGPGG
jgi:hypothetical protein